MSESAPEVNGETISLHGNSVGFLRAGEGPVLLLLHGIAGSYGLNCHMLGRGSSNTRWGTINNVTQANTVPLFIDALRFDLWPYENNTPAANEFAAWGSNNDMPRCCINRHDGTVCCLFVDSTARRVGLKELWTLKWHKSYDTAGLWTIAGGVQSNDWPEWLRPYKDY